MVFVQTKKCRHGFLTLEILLAMEVMILTLAAVVLTVFGVQNMVADSQASSEALINAQKIIEAQRILARKDFRLVNSTSTVDGIFQENVEVSSRSFLTKEIKATVSWNTGSRSQKIELLTLIADYNATAGNDTCDSNLSGDWAHPQIKQFDFSQMIGTLRGAISDADAYKSKLYVALDDTDNAADPTFFVFNISNPENIELINKIDNSENKSGLSSIAAAGDYVYAANISSAKQMQIINVAKTPIEIAAEYEVPGVTGGKGSSIFYKNGYVYLGLTKSDSGAEFNIINVKDLNHINLAGSVALGSKINAIFVRGDYAYLSVADNSRELVVLDIKNPAAPAFANIYNIAPDQINWGYGKSIGVIGDKLYLSRTYIANSPEFYIFNVSDRAVNLLGEYPKINNPFSGNDFVVRGPVIFLLAGSGSQGGSLRLLDASDYDNIIERLAISLPNGTTGTGGTAMDCEGNYLYIGSVDGEGRGHLSIITAK
ncbi:MAG: hypothetical protein WCX69_01175 [Candidatus Paceibacterota bacterium]